MNKLTVAVIFGGQSSEHEVSRVSASTIIANLDPEKYYVIPVGITKSGKWMIYNGPVENIKNGEWEKFGTPAILSPDASQRGLLKIVGGKVKLIPIDLAFPVLHGKYGEDGTIQGLFELAKLPYVGCGVLASAVSMDKFFTKIIADRVGVRQAAYEPVMKEEIAGTEGMAEAVKRVEARFAYPVFIKPSNAGSSRGVSKAENREQLTEGLTEAARHDRKILVEETIVGHEIECAVFGNGKEPVIASGVGEVLAAAQFYDFEAKYFNAESRTVVNPELPGDSAERVRRAAVEIFKAVDGYGLARVDFFVTKDGDVVFMNKHNAGFTAISMYPMLFEAAGISKTELVGKLIEHGMNGINRRAS